jgi:hypothetical protein
MAAVKNCTDWIFQSSLIGWKIQVTVLFIQFCRGKRAGGSLEKTTDFLDQAFLFPVPLQAVFRSPFRIFDIRFNFCLLGDHRG